MSIRKLQNIYAATHPAARMKRKEDPADERAEEERADLLAQLDAEADEDGDG